MKPIEIAEQYETTYFDGDAPLGQSETKDGVGIDRVKGDERLRDPEFIVVCVKQGPSNPGTAFAGLFPETANPG
jgi:hypothetical protein